MSYVVCVKPPEDHPGSVRVFGTFRARDIAETFCEKIRAAIDLDSVDFDFQSGGFAYVMAIEKPRIRIARRWAKDGER